jgi:hypothetical protein
MLLQMHHGVDQSHATALSNIMRASGVRRDNCFMNTGSDQYAFNSLQQSFLPSVYCPPASAAKGGAS